jgi:hypothetical protein
LVLVIGMLVSMLFPAVNSSHRASSRNVCINNLRQITLAILNYEFNHGTLPPAYIADANGKPMHSWRVLILPYLEATALYEQYDFNEPWDGPNNSKLASQIADVFRCPGHGPESSVAANEADYFVVTGSETAFPGGQSRRISEIKDGVSSTIALIEATGLGIKWMEPRDVTLDEALRLFASGEGGHRGVHDSFLSTTYYETTVRSVAFLDGHSEYIYQLDDASDAIGSFTVSGGEPLPMPPFDGHYAQRAGVTVMKWKKVYSLALFVLLSLLPAEWARRRELSKPRSGDSA